LAKTALLSALLLKRFSPGQRKVELNLPQGVDFLPPELGQLVKITAKELERISVFAPPGPSGEISRNGFHVQLSSAGIPK